MAFFTGWAEALQATRLAIADSVGVNDPINYQRPTGMLDYLLNPSLNPTNIQAEMVRQGANNEFRDVQIRWHQHRCDGDLVTTDASASCTKNNQVRDQLTTVQPDLFVMDKFTLYEDYLRENNEAGLDKQTRLTTKFAESMRVCRESMSSQLLAKAAGLFGANPAAEVGAGLYHSFQAIDSNSGVDIGQFDTMVNHQLENYMTGPLALVGFSGNPRKYFNRLAVGNLNTNAGVNVADIARQFGALFFQDYSSTANLGNANRVLAFYPGLQQFFSYNTKAGEFGKSSPDNLISGVMPDTIHNFNWDFDISFDRQCTENGGINGAWVVRVWLYFDIFNIPEAAFGDTYCGSDGLNDFNGVVGYEMTNA